MCFGGRRHVDEEVPAEKSGQQLKSEAGGQDTVVHWAVVAEARQLALELIDLRPLPRILAAYSV